MKSAKTFANYWMSRTYFHQNATGPEPVLSARIQYLGRRERFSLGSANREIAAGIAAEIYRSLESNGWEPTVAYYKRGEIIATPKEITIGDYLAAVRKVWPGAQSTINLYIRHLRKIVGQTENIDPGNRRYDHMSGGAEEWHGWIDAVPLSAITDQKVNTWKIGFLGMAEPSEEARNKRKISINSYLRSCKSLFGKDLVKKTGLELPSPLPFAGVDFFGGTDQRYFSNFDIRKLLVTAKEQLVAFNSDMYAVVLLSAFAGLRRKEIDLLEWPSIDFKHGVIQLKITEFFDGKTRESLRPIPFREPWVLDWFKARKAELGGKAGFVIAPGLPYAPDQRNDYYRTEEVLERTTRWLRSHGVKTARPLHTLRKEAGSDIVRRAGLVAAAAFLRHKTTAVTMMHYSDYRATETPSFGDIVEPANVVQFAAE